MTYYTGLKGKTYITEGNCINSGGEGEIFKIKGEKNQIAKIFKAGKNTEARRRKLLAIISATENCTENQWVVWPVDILTCNGKFAGYVMPVLEGGRALNVMYSTDSGLTLKQKIQVARNLCLAVNSVHGMGQLIGDLNPDNILVNPKTLNVRLIDSDSYHFHDRKRTYRCEVGVDLLYPRELQKKFSGGVTPATAELPTFNRHTDVFALAVHIFALLMNGAHPYCCAVNGAYNMARLTQPMPSITVPQPVEAIRDGFFPYVDRKTGITTPSYVPDYKMYPSGNSCCPWCELDKKKYMVAKAVVNGAPRRPANARTANANAIAVNSNAVKANAIKSRNTSNSISANANARNNSKLNIGEMLCIALLVLYSGFFAFPIICLTAYQEMVNSGVAFDFLLWGGLIAILVFYAHFFENNSSTYSRDMMNIWFCVALTMFNLVFTYRSTMCHDPAAELLIWVLGPIIALIITAVLAGSMEDGSESKEVTVVRIIAIIVSITIGLVGFYTSLMIDIYSPKGDYYFTLFAESVVLFAAIIVSIWCITEPQKH